MRKQLCFEVQTELIPIYFSIVLTTIRFCTCKVQNAATRVDWLEAEAYC